MTYSATITSKRQLTIPVEIFRKLGLREGEKVLIKEEDGAMKIMSMLKLVHELAGSVKLPKRFRGLPIDEVIKRAKEEYFRAKYSKKNGIY